MKPEPPVWVEALIHVAVMLAGVLLLGILFAAGGAFDQPAHPAPPTITRTP